MLRIARRRECLQRGRRIGVQMSAVWNQKLNYPVVLVGTLCSFICVWVISNPLISVSSNFPKWDAFI